MKKNYEELKNDVLKLKREGKVSTKPSPEQRIDWAYGNTKIENDEVTLDLVKRVANQTKSR